MRDVLFTKTAFEQYNDWSTIDKNIFKKLCKLIKETLKVPFDGTGKPEPLKHDLKGYWSRRITDEHRLVIEWKIPILKLFLVDTIMKTK